jgi:hypothetical protein
MAEGAAAAKPRLTYFKILGLGEAIRLVFADRGEELENDYIEGDWAERKAAGIAVRAVRGVRRRARHVARCRILSAFDSAMARVF